MFSRFDDLLFIGLLATLSIGLKLILQLLITDPYLTPASDELR